ncbi:hypothetical protein PLESTB_001727100 [Pleodorina starrii]|uniref:Uncharacterized protein n=1 Tax=Pleodorina starrii TaxID=330485 RepID=A0A9W6F9W9_9CHLO|nr:hypothetical protein PLESTB_001727100 [Pleodorina starrii]GLC75764.1 hypothetical protein PLESTF_001683000 [Pleodorina starrii]
MAIPQAAAIAPSLPDPQDSQLEISFRRLLESCLTHLQALDAAAAAAAAGSTAAATATTPAGGGGGDAAAGVDGSGSGAAASASGGGADSDTAARILKMRHYVDTLRELLSDLRAQQDTLGLDAATLDLYDTHVKAVAAAVPKVQLPPYCQGLISGSAIAPGGGGYGGGGSCPAPPNLSYLTPPPARPGVTPAGGARAGPSGRGAEAGGLSSAASERLREAEAAQALLTDELAGLTAALKANALGMAGAVSERGRLLEATDAALGDSLAATKKNTAEAGRQVKRSGGNLCFTVAVLLAVGLAFTAMVLYIKFTNLMGYRAAPSTSTSTSPPPPLSFGGGGGAGGWAGSAGGGGGAVEGFAERQPHDVGGPWREGHGGEL